MSYDLESGGPGFRDDPAFEELAHAVSEGLFTLASNISTTNRLLSLLGTKRDKPDLRERMRSLTDETRDRCKDMGGQVKRLQSWADVTSSQRFTQQKLSREFASSLADFQGLQRLSAEKQRAYVEAAKTALHEEDETEDGLRRVSADDEALLQEQMEQQQQLVDQGDVDFNDTLIQEREEEIRGIETGITELNEIFQDLGTMVTEQGALVDNIESNISNVHDRTRGAATELTKAARYQRNSRNKMFCLLIILAVILTIVLLAVFLG